MAACNQCRYLRVALLSIGSLLKVLMYLHYCNASQEQICNDKRFTFLKRLIDFMTRTYK